MPEACPKCGHKNIIKHGFILQKQRYKCKSCNYQFTTTNRERGKPKWMKVMTILLYVSGLSMNAIAQLFNVSAQAVLNWVRDYAKTHCEKPEPGSAVIVELDEFWHFIESKKKSYGYGKLMIVIEIDSLTGNWEVVIAKL